MWSTLCKFRCSPVSSPINYLLILLVLLSSNLVSILVSGQNTGTAVQLDNAELGTVNSHAANKARIQAELENEEQARKHAQNVVRLAATDQLNSEIITNRTRAYLSCESGEMIVKINFTEPFRGVGYSDYDRSSPCKFYGDGGRYYEMRMPLKGCGTKQEAPRIFINNIILRFHRSLELEEDEIKTIICRYPPPLAPPPPIIAAPILEQPPELAPILPAKLSEVELMLIVSALLFLTLLLLGIGMGYYCLKRRNIKVVRKIPPSSPPSEFTYVPPIPRVSLSSSEASIISQTSSVRRDDFRYENLGYIPEPKFSHVDDFFRSEQYLTDEDVDIIRQNVIAPPLPYLHRYDDHFITNASQTDIDEDIEVGRLIVPKKPKITTLITDDYFVTPTTTTEIIDEVTKHRVIVPPEKPLTTKTIDDTFITPQSITEIDDEVTHQKVFGPSKITTQNIDDLYMHDESETDVIDEETRHRLYGPREPELTIQTVDDYFVHPEEDTEVIDDVTKQRLYGPRHPHTKVVDDYYHDVYEIDEIVDDTTHDKIFGPQPTTRTIQTSDDELVTQSRDVEEFIDDTRFRVMAPRKPKITVKNIDDFYVTNITETETTEQVIKTGRSMPNLALMPEPEDEEESPPICSGFDITMRSIPLKPGEEPPRRTTITTSDTTITKTSTSESIKCDTILRIISNPPPTIENLPKHFPPPIREKLRTMIVTDEVFRTLIIESTTIEEYTERIQKHTFYGPVFEPPTWQVIFRLWSLPEVIDADRREPLKKKKPLDSLRSYRSGFSAHEVRSVTEEDVSFSRRRLTSSHFVPLPDYPTDDESTLPHWASHLPEPRRYELYPRDYSPITPAFGTTPRRPRQRVDPELHTTSSVFGPRYLVNPYTTGSPSARRRLLEYSQRPYSPDLDALSLEPSSGVRSRTYQAYSSAGSMSRQSRQMRASEEHEEIKSTTETDVYDWKRYS